MGRQKPGCNPQVSKILSMSWASLRVVSNTQPKYKYKNIVPNIKPNTNTKTWALSTNRRIHPQWGFPMSWSPVRIAPNTRYKNTNTKIQNRKIQIEKPGHYPQVSEFIPMSWSPLSGAKYQIQVTHTKI